ncbi:MAG: T9SS type A sorting domain-containing protein [Bacteroidota bacterium]
MKKALLIPFFLFFITVGMYSQTGNIDPTFNATVGAGTNGAINSIAVQTDGKIIMAGAFTNYAYTPKNRIARLNSDGTIDTNFNIGTGANNGINSVAIQEDGKILILGGFTSYNGIAKNGIARLNADGTLDITFTPGTGLNSYVSHAVQTDGKILIGGYFTSYNGVTIKHIARLNPDGTLDTTFNLGVGPGSTVRKVIVKPNGKILITGDFLDYNGVPRKNIAQLNEDGTLDTSFNPGTGANGIESVALQADGKILIGGYFASYNGASKSCLAQLNADGSLNTAFNLGVGPSSSVREIIVQPSGKILIGGAFTSYNNIPINRIARLNADGTLDATLDPGTGANDNVSSIAIKTDGKIVIAGNFSSYNDTAIGKIALLNSNGTLDTAFLNPGGFQIGAQSVIFSTVLQADGKILIGGDFFSYNGTNRTRIARLNSDGTLDTSFNPGTGSNGRVYSIAVQTDGKILIGGTFTGFNGISKNRITRLNADGTLDTTFNPGTAANAMVYAIVLQTDGKILISGEFPTFNGTTKNRIARLNADGTLDATFAPVTGASGPVYSMGLQTDGKILISGAFTSYDGVTKNYITRLNTNGTLDATFNVGGSGVEWSTPFLKLQSDGKILIAGQFVSYNNTAIDGIARLNSDGTIDTTFQPKIMVHTNSGTNQKGIITVMTPQSDGKILIGGLLTSYDGVPRNSIALLNNDGSLDTTFDLGTGANSTVENILIQPDGKILVAGWFTTYNGNPVGRITRLLPSDLALSTEEFNNKTLTIYPNPSTGIFNINSNQNIENTSIKVFDLNGRIVHQSKKNTENKVLDLTNFQNGIYILNIENGAYNYSQKIIKQ